MNKKQKNWEAEMSLREAIALGFVSGLIVMTIVAGILSFSPLQQQLEECQDDIEYCLEKASDKSCYYVGGDTWSCTKYKEDEGQRFACCDVCRTDYSIVTKKEFACCLWRCDRKYSNFDFSEENNPCLEQPVRECVEWEDGWSCSLYPGNILSPVGKDNCFPNADGCNTTCCDDYNRFCTTTLIWCASGEGGGN